MLYKKKILLCIVLNLMLLLMGCGENSQPIVQENNQVQNAYEEVNQGEVNGDNEEKVFTNSEGKTVYYLMEEMSLPDPDKELKEVIKNEKYITGEPALHNDIVYRYVIVFDEEGNHKDYYLQTMKISEKEWKCISATEDFEIDGRVYSTFREPFVSEGDELYCYVYCEEERKEYLGKLGESGVEKIVCAISTDLQELNDKYIGYQGRLAYDKSGRFYFFHQAVSHKEWGDLAFLDGITQVQKETEVDGKIRNIVQDTNDGAVYWYGLNEEQKVTIRNIMTDEVFLDDFTGVDGYECEAKFSASGICYLADRRSIWKIADGKAEQVFDFIEEDYIVDELYNMESGEDGKIQMLVELDGGYALLEIRESETPMETTKQEISIALAREHLSLQKAIVRFNRQSDRYHISVVLPKAGESESEFRDRIQMEISVGKGPDIIGHDVIPDISPYVENDYLECLDGLLDKEDEYLTAALEGCRIDGSLYGIPYDCSLKFVSYSNQYTKDKSSWTLEELMQAVQKSDAKILQGGYDGLDIVKYYGLYDNSNTDYIDWEKGVSHLTEKPFLDLLAFAKKYADTGLLDGEAGELAMSGEAFATEVTMNSMRYMYYLYNCFEGEPAMIGYPREEGNGIYVSSREMYINSSSDSIEGAKKFLKYLLSEEVQMMYVDFDIYEEMPSGGYWGHVPQFPIYLDSYEVLLDKARKAKGTVSGSIDGVFYEETALSDAQAEQFNFLLKNAQPNDSNIKSIFGIVEEELAPYFAGEVTAEQAAKILDNRVQLYLDENND